MEHAHSPKTPLQIRLDHAELAALDTYIARFTDFPPSRVDVVRKAVTEWLAQKLAPAPPAQALQCPEVVEAPVPPSRPVIKEAWYPIVAFLQQRQNIPARPDEIAAAVGAKPESVAAHLRFMREAGIVGFQEVGQGKAKRKAYFLTVL
jgi:hypothetical protein